MIFSGVKEDGYSQDSIYMNYLSGDAYATAIPPAIRIHIIENLGTDLDPLRVAENMMAFIKYARAYGLNGWQGIAQSFAEGKRPKRTKTQQLQGLPGL